MGVRKVREAKDSMETPDVSEGKERERGTAGSGQALGERLRLEGPCSILYRQPGFCKPQVPRSGLSYEIPASHLHCSVPSSVHGRERSPRPAEGSLHPAKSIHPAPLGTPPPHKAKGLALKSHPQSSPPPKKKKKPTMASKDSILNFGLTSVPKSRS